MTNTTAIKPHALFTALESIEWFKANQIKGSVLKTFKNGEILVEFDYMQDFPGGAQPYTERIRGAAMFFEGVL